MSTVVGLTALTRMPPGPNSIAATFVSPTTPQFEAAYETYPGTANNPWTEAVLTIADRGALSAAPIRIPLITTSIFTSM